MYDDLISFVKSQYPGESFIPLHAPVFKGKERDYLLDTIDSTFVSSVGQYVTNFEIEFAKKHDVKYAIATSNGTSALHMAMIIAGVKPGDLVITQALTFVATCNAISYCGASPVFLDVDKETLGLSPDELARFLRENCERRPDGAVIEKISGRQVRAVIPMHTFGHACKIDELRSICDEYDLFLIEDAAEAVGSKYKGQPLGTYGHIAAFSFNGNKIITTGGGGMITTNDDELAQKAKHLTTTAKKPHKWHFEHDDIGYNYRMPNLNAALGLAQLEQLDSFIDWKRELATRYQDFFHGSDLKFVSEPNDCTSNYWLNAILAPDEKSRDAILEATNNADIQTRPIWTPMYDLPMFESATAGLMPVTKDIFKRLINLPSGIHAQSMS